MKRIAAVSALVCLCACLPAMEKAYLALLFRGSQAEIRSWVEKNAPNLDEEIFVDLRPIMLAADRYDPEGSEASRAEAKSIYEYFIERGARIDPWSSARVGDLTRLTAQLSKDPDAKEFVTGKGDTLLCGAAKSGSLECLAYLLSLRIDPDGIDALGATALMYAARRGDLAMAQKLVEFGAEVNAADDNGFSPLRYAKEKNRKAVIEFLLEKGAQD